MIERLKHAGNKLMWAASVGVIACGCQFALADAPEFDVSILVQEGDPMPDGDGTVGLINDISVNNHGEWIVDVNVSGGSVSRALLRNGSVWIKPGDPIDPRDTVSSVANLLKHLNNNGDVAWRPGLDENHSGIYRNFTPLILRDDFATAPQFSPRTPYIGFFRARISDNDHIWAIVTVNDSDLPGTVHRAMVLLTIDPDTGDVTEDALVVRHDPAPGTEAGVTFDQINSDASTFAVSNDGSVLFSSPFNNAPAGTQGGLYINDTLMVRRGDPSPIPGSNYANIGASATRADLNNNGDYIFMSTLTDQPTETNTVIVRNNMFTDGPDEIVVQRGDPVPGVDGETIDSLGTGVQPQITDNGDVVWYGRFTGDSATNQGLFLNEHLLLQKGVTSVDGNLITTVAGTTGLSNGITQSVVASDNGQFIILRAQFADGSRAALLVEIEIDDPDPEELIVDFDIRPGSCPNPLNRKSQGVLPTAILGTADFDVLDIDVSTLQLRRADGVGGAVTPLTGPPGPGIGIEDVGTPVNGDDPCDCHDLGGDGFDDLTLKFRTPDLVAAFELDDLSGGATVELVIEGQLSDGTPFSGIDCVRLVGPGSGGGMQVLLLMLGQWGQCPADQPCESDLTGNGSVGVDDLLILMQSWH